MYRVHILFFFLSLFYTYHTVIRVFRSYGQIVIWISTSRYLRQGGYVFTLFVCLFVSRITENYSADFLKIRWKRGS